MRGSDPILYEHMQRSSERRQELREALDRWETEGGAGPAPAAETFDSDAHLGFDTFFESRMPRVSSEGDTQETS